MGSWKIKKMSGHCGARLEGVSLVNASKSDLEEMQSALFEYGVIVLPDQNLTPENHINLAEFFGPIDVNRFFTPVASHPNISFMGGSIWGFCQWRTNYNRSIYYIRRI